MVDANIMEKSCSEYQSAVVLVRKKNTNEMRFCVDFRKLNQTSKPISYPLPCMQDVLDSLGDKPFAYVSSLDLRQAYMQVFLDQESREKTAFVVRPGEKYDYLRMPFGEKGAPSTFSLLMSKVFDRSLGFDRVIPYLDDVLVWSSSFEEHLQHLRMVFERLLETGLRLYPKKCAFAKTETQFLN